MLQEQVNPRHSMYQEEWKFRWKLCRTLKSEGTLERLKQVVTSSNIPRNIQSTLYNPIRGQNINWSEYVDLMEAAVPNMLMLSALQANYYPLVDTKRVCFKLPAKARPRIYFSCLWWSWISRIAFIQFHVKFIQYCLKWKEINQFWKLKNKNKHESSRFEKQARLQSKIKWGLK